MRNYVILVNLAPTIVKLIAKIIYLRSMIWQPCIICTDGKRKDANGKSFE
jgi:hypothetical protein